MSIWYVFNRKLKNHSFVIQLKTTIPGYPSYLYTAVQYCCTLWSSVERSFFDFKVETREECAKSVISSTAMKTSKEEVFEKRLLANFATLMNHLINVSKFKYLFIPSTMIMFYHFDIIFHLWKLSLFHDILLFHVLAYLAHSFIELFLLIY